VNFPEDLSRYIKFYKSFDQVIEYIKLYFVKVFKNKLFDVFLLKLNKI